MTTGLAIGGRLADHHRYEFKFLSQRDELLIHAQFSKAHPGFRGGDFIQRPHHAFSPREKVAEGRMRAIRDRVNAAFESQRERSLKRKHYGSQHDTSIRHGPHPPLCGTFSRWEKARNPRVSGSPQSTTPEPIMSLFQYEWIKNVLTVTDFGGIYRRFQVHSES